VQRLSSVVRPSVSPSVNICASRFFSQTNGWIATKLAHDGSQPGLHPGCAQGQGQSRSSRDTGTFVISQKSLLLQTFAVCDSSCYTIVVAIWIFFVLFLCNKLFSFRPSWCHFHSLSLASVKSRSVWSFWYRRTEVVPDKGPLNGCCCCRPSFMPSFPRWIKSWWRHWEDCLRASGTVYLQRPTLRQPPCPSVRL